MDPIVLFAFVFLLQVNSGDFPHLMVYGPPGAGKKTRIICLLRELYGAGVEKLKLEQQTFEVFTFCMRGANVVC